MAAAPDVVDSIQERLATLYPDLDTSGFGVTGRLLRVAHAVMQHRVEHLATFDLTPGDFDVLATIRRTQGPDGVNPSRVLESVLITSGGLTKRLDRLQTAGLLERHPDPADRRGTLLALTGDGQALLDRAMISLLSTERDMVAGLLTDRQTEALTDLLRRLSTLRQADLSQ